MGKKRSKKKIDVRKKRAKLLKERKKEQPIQDITQDRKKVKTEKEEALEIRLKKETRLYWIRAITGLFSALIGRFYLGLTSWWLFLWMASFWFGFPFFVSFVIFRYDYDEEEWNWKNIIKPGIGIFFFLFMIVAIFIHTMLLFS